MAVGLPLVVSLLLQAAPTPASPAPPVAAEAPSPAPVVREIALEGSTLYTHDDAVRILRQREGQPLRATPEALATRLEARYHIDGYLAASVVGRMEDDRLVLVADEGRIASVAVEGLRGASEKRAIRAANLKVGQVLEQVQIWDALARIENESNGALKPEGEPPYSVERGPDGARVVLRVRKIAVTPRLGLAGPRAAGRYNRVDGLSTGLIGELYLHDTKSYDDLRLYGFGAFGWSSKESRFAFGTARAMGPESAKVRVGYEYYDLTDTDDTWHKVGLEEGTGASINSESTADFFRRIGHQVYAVLDLGRPFQVGASFRFDHYTSLPVVAGDSFFSSKDTARPNPPVEEGRMRSLILTAAWVSKGALFPTKASRRQSYLERNLYLRAVTKPEAIRVEATFEAARPDWGSDYDFTRTIGNVRTHHDLGDHFMLDTRFVGGHTTGDAPSFKRFYIGGQGTLRGYTEKEFDGHEMAIFSLETGLVPGGHWPAFIPFYDGGRTWGVAINPSGRWLNAVGAGLRWPARASSFFVRVDAAYPFDVDPGQDKKLHFTFLVRLPI